jgi:uncharacterized membrane protein YphA (DoxX/SURF4 family)
MATLIYGLLAFGAGWGLAAFFLPHQYPDFGVFWTAARHAFDPRLYDGAYLTAAQSWWPGMTPHPFVYPPTFLLLAWPFGLPPFALADYLWGGVSCCAFLLSARQLVRPAWAALILPFCVPVAMAAAYGQSIFLAGAALIAGVALVERRPWLAGMLIAVAMSLKPQVTILAPLVMLSASWRHSGRVSGRVAAGAIGAGAALFAGSLVFGPGHWLEWLAALPRFANLIREMRLSTVNLLQPDLAAPEKLLVVAAGVGFAAWSQRGAPPQRVVGIVCGSLCCASYAVRPDLAVLAPSALAWVLGGRTPAAWLRRIAGLALMLGVAATPVALALVMLASVIAGIAEQARLTEAPLTALWPRWRSRQGPAPSANPL